MIKPPCLKAKDRVAIIAPASRPARPSLVKRAEALVREMGFTPIIGDNILKTHGYMAGTEEERLTDLAKAISEESIRAIWCITGGYGTLPLLPHLQYQRLIDSPKIILGAEDISHLLLAVSKKAQLVTLHGPNCDRINSKNVFEKVKRALTHCEYPDVISHDAVLDHFSFSAVPGMGKGRTLAGNLTAIVSLFGTQFEPDLDGRILLLEDARERNDILDRWFTTLYVSGKLSSVAAVGMGSFEGCDSRSAVNMLSFEELAYDRLVEMGIPSCFNLSFGQGGDNVIPVGINASLDTESGKLSFLEPVLSK